MVSGTGKATNQGTTGVSAEVEPQKGHRVRPCHAVKQGGKTCAAAKESLTAKLAEAKKAEL